MKLEEDRRNAYLERQRLADERKKIRLEEEKKNFGQKKHKDVAKDEHRKIVRQQMVLREDERKQTVLGKIDEINTKVQMTQAKRHQERRRKCEQIALKREDREETVNRISRMNDYRKEKLMEKIELDNDRSAKINNEKAALIETRQMLRKKVERQKAKVMEVFEKMKKKGKIDVIYRIIN